MDSQLKFLAKKEKEDWSFLPFANFSLYLYLLKLFLWLIHIFFNKNYGNIYILLKHAHINHRG